MTKTREEEKKKKKENQTLDLELSFNQVKSGIDRYLSMTSLKTEHLKNVGYKRSKW